MPFEINNPISGGNLQVADNDFPSKMKWNEAMSACQSLGNGWRLPSLEELNAMHVQLHRQGKGNFKTEDCDWYWSSSELGAFSKGQFSFRFWSFRELSWLGKPDDLEFDEAGYDGLADYMDPDFYNYVRAVRNLP